MAGDSTDTTAYLPRQIRAELGAFRTATERRFDALASDRVEGKRALRGWNCMMAAFTGRLEDIGTRVDRLATT